MRNDRGYGMGCILNGLKRRLRNVSKLKGAWRPGFLWLYRNRYLRMDANVDINDLRRRRFHMDRYEFAACSISEMKKAGASILDAACGTGYGTNILEKSGAGRVIGIDISPEAIEYAEKKYGSAVSSFKAFDVTKLDKAGLAADGFDATVSFETIEHIEDPLSFLRCVAGLLKEDGIFIASTPNKWGITKDHKIDYDYKMFREDLEKFFEIESVWVQNSGCMEEWINRGQERRLVRATPENIEEAECFLAICRQKYK